MKKLKTILFSGAILLVMCFVFAGCGELDSGFLEVYGYCNETIESKNLSLELNLNCQNLTYTSNFDFENYAQGEYQGVYEFDKANNQVLIHSQGVVFTFDIEGDNLVFKSIFGTKIVFEGQKNNDVLLYRANYQTPKLKEELINLKVGLNDEKGRGQIALKFGKDSRLGYTIDFSYKIEGNTLTIDYNNKVFPGLELPNVLVRENDKITMQAFGKVLCLEKI